MSKVYMVTLPRTRTYAEGNAIFRVMRAYDIKRWVVGAEEGANGYKHWQIRMEWRGSFEELKVIMGQKAHIEEASDTWTYEAKEGCYWTSKDRKENRQQRFGKFRYSQERIYEALQETNDREVVLWYDERGCCGKSWFTRALWERGQAYFTVADSSAKTLIQDIASEYVKNGWRPIVCIDIPRAAKWTPDLYEAIERIKDGLIKDPRYSASSINISGVKVLICTNTMPKLDKLSWDRWVIKTQEELEIEARFLGKLP